MRISAHCSPKVAKKWEIVLKVLRPTKPFLFWIILQKLFNKIVKKAYFTLCISCQIAFSFFEIDYLFLLRTYTRPQAKFELSIFLIKKVIKDEKCPFIKELSSVCSFGTHSEFISVSTGLCNPLKSVATSHEATGHEATSHDATSHVTTHKSRCFIN